MREDSRAPLTVLDWDQLHRRHLLNVFFVLPVVELELASVAYICGGKPQTDKQRSQTRKQYKQLLTDRL